ncbi:hypothetical protein BC629DRAFT_1289259 [Irpex lacteus]|nr:hypothetical protein BC629DRAFT_1289259 [Irpex lacteus]
MDAYPLAITHPDTSASNIKERDLELNVGRPLVVCLDGTGNEGSTGVFESNVARFYAMLMKGHNVEQKVYYQAGIGTYTSPWFLTSLARNFSKALDKAIAWNLNTHVQEAYKYIMDHYENDSKICIFGFSRGAYIARALAGMIQKVGLLPPGNDQQIPFAYRLYEDNSESGWKRSTNFKKAQCVDVDIDFLGVWDTVDSVGFIRGKELPFTKSNRSVKVFRHALSLDERRAKFHQFCWHWSSGKEAMQGVGEGDMLKAGKKLRKSYIPDVQEVWFAGCHSDVGGSVTAEQIRPFPPSLAHISLRWMIQQCFDTDTGIIFDLKRLKEIGLEFPEFEGQIIEASRPIVASKEKKPMPSKELEDLDATRSIHDQLSENWFWWILEVCWLRHPVQKKDGSWGYKRTSVFFLLPKRLACSYRYRSCSVHSLVSTWARGAKSKNHQSL